MQRQTDDSGGLIFLYHDGTGWTPRDAIQSQLDNWRLIIGVAGMAVQRVGSTELGWPDGKPVLIPDKLARLVEQAMSGDALSYKALYLMVYNDPRYKEYHNLVQALKPQYA